MAKPWRVIRPFTSPSLVITAIASGSLVWNQYGLLTPIRYVLNPRYGLQSPLQCGLLYLAPGVGYMVGTLGSGRWADYVSRKWYKKRDMVFVAEDRLYAVMPFMMVMLPTCMLIYGWSVERASRGLVVPVVFMFLQEIAQLFCYPSLNTYCLDVRPEGFFS
jgi:predicted MFS family arabinose efflux permease